MRGYPKPIPEELLADHSYRRNALVPVLSAKTLHENQRKGVPKHYTKIEDGFIYVTLAGLAGVNHSYFIRETTSTTPIVS